MKMYMCNKYTSIISFLFIITVNCDNNDLFSSTYEMHRLLLKESQFSQKLFEYQNKLESHLKSIKNYLSDVYDSKPLDVNDPFKYVENPLNSLGMFYRLARKPFFHNFHQTLLDANDISKLNQELIESVKEFPSVIDFEDAARGVSLLQEAYDLEPDDLVKGLIRFENQTFSSEHNLQWDEMEMLGKTTCEQGWIDTGLNWYQRALDKCWQTLSNKNLCEKLNIDYEIGKDIHDQYLDKRGPLSSDHRCNQLPFSKKLLKKKKFKKIKKNGIKKTAKYTKFVPLYDQSVTSKHQLYNFHSMCKIGSDGWRTAEMDAKLRCRFHHQNNPYLKLLPLKMEEISHQPATFVFHEFLHQSEINSLLDFAHDKLERSLVGGDLKTTKTRTSKQTWLHESFYNIVVGRNKSIDEYKKTKDSIPIIPFEVEKFLQIKHDLAFRISQRLEDATKLKIIGPISSEAYQIANYGMGGQYATHYDSNGFFGTTPINAKKSYERNMVIGDRIITAMGYLSDVEQGGRTVFPMTGITSRPVKGNLIIWWNIKSDGNQDKLTSHGGCPVLVGSKWITNKWVGSSDQFLNYPCSLEKDQPYNIPKMWNLI